MSVKFRVLIKISAVLLLIFFSSCKEDTVQPVLYGSISGVVINDSTASVIEGAGVTTTPPTSAILTGSDGKFLI